MGLKKYSKGEVKGWFIPYLHITNKIVNETSKLISFIDLLPHVNLIDIFITRNIYLPSAITDTYTVTLIFILSYLNLSFHNDWVLTMVINFGKSNFHTQTLI